ncbi:MAG: PASTA domain-containing protein, partial [Micromonosporaceae bacterium]|nr:PASTA domain-containing protein [Micromonosporaceae bacterium]
MRLPLPRLRRLRLRLSRRLVLRAGLAAVLAAGALAVGFGSGYKSANVVLTDDGGYVQKGNRVVHVNAASRGVDAEAPSDSTTDGSTQLQVTQDGSGAVIVVDPTTHQVTRLPTDTLAPAPVPQAPAAPGLTASAGGGKAYLLDPKGGTVSQLPDGAGTAPVTVDTPEKVDQMVVDGSGTAWAYNSSTGDLFQISGDKVSDKQRAAHPGDHVTLTLAGGRPVVYDSSTGVGTGYGQGPALVPVVTGISEGLAAAPETPPVEGSHGDPELVVVASNADLAVADLSTGQVRQVVLPDQSGNQFGAPVVAFGRVYLPNFTKRQVTILDLATLRVVRKVHVWGASSQFQISVQGDRVWVNDPYERQMISFDANGNADPIDKGHGDGLTTGDPAPSASTSQPPNQPPGVPNLPPGPTVTPHTTTSQPKPQPPRRVTVPKLVGLTRAAARQACQRAGLDCRFVASNTGTGQTDVVISADPAQGSTVNRGSAVNVVYRGPASVPNVVGEKFTQACAGLQAVQLGCTGQPGALAPNAPAVAVVYQQAPTAGTPLHTGKPVTLTYYSDLVSTPAVVGQTWQAACAYISAAGLACNASNIGVPPPGTANGVVVAQAPVAGAGANPAQPVTVQYYGSTGVPNLYGANPVQACQVLQAALLTCNGSDTEQTTACNVVHSQSIGAGTVVAPGTPVTFTYLDACPVPLHKWNQRNYGCRDACNGNFFNNQINLWGVYIGIGGPPPGFGPGAAGYQNTAQPDIGSAYPASDAGKGGLMAVYESYKYPQICLATNSCTPDQMKYYLSGNPQPSPGYTSAGPVFSCFNSGLPQPAGTRPLWALFDGRFWVWAVIG